MKGDRKMNFRITLLSAIFLLYSIAPSSADNQTSIFNNKEGTYNGSVNGILFLKTGDTEIIDSEIVAISGATVSSQAVVNIINNTTSQIKVQMNQKGLIGNGR